MCQPSWGRARVEAQRLSDLARLRRVRDRIDREYGRPLDIEVLARAANLPAAPLGRQFLLAYGLAPYAYLMTRRIEHATALLRRGDLSVAEVCSAVGGPSLDTFRTCFTERVGVSPDVYRQRAIGAAADVPSVRNGEAPLTGPRLA
ncbi:helix-turn-helix domain-containing protein [Streptomyces kanamyceticus]|uniref:AraC family transcriptional regulator n=1 Tax=Streptomyces kanamyceticus TaxID=1967 RepID=A0A5J6GQZ4_STRKN|nr:AraC family transcriptional regulator [Streptomyces kanamyceticus]QEU96794.1 AraC family transcriptional regulator [Streptomyces kanamyceticus]